MPQTLTYPGVYVEEVPSGVRTITGVSTSDTAFVDFFGRGPVNEPVRVTSFADFERRFGGLDRRSAASYAIQQYYLNGGQIAYVVRVASAEAARAGATLPNNGDDILTVEAANAGVWGQNLRVTVTAAGAGFHLTVEEVRGGTVVDSQLTGGEVVRSETYFNLSMNALSTRYAINVVNNESQLVQLVRASEADNNAAPAAVANRRLEGAATDDGDVPGSDEWTANGGTILTGTPAAKSGIYALEKIAPFVFNLLCIPAAADLPDLAAGSPLRSVYAAAIAFCRQKRAFLILDIPPTVNLDKMDTWLAGGDGAGTTSLVDDHAAVYFPRVNVPDPLDGLRPRNVPASGTLAGVYARTDAARGIWKAPAGTDATLRNASVAVTLNDLENGGLNQLGVNVLRNFAIYGNVAWGARTANGSNAAASEYKYIPVRRTALYIGESLYQGLKWVVFEPNDERLWAQIRLNVGSFMNNLFRQGAFQGSSARQAYFVKCDGETTTQNDINLGVVNIVVGFAPLKPAEFVVIHIQQMAGQLAV